MKSSTTPDFWSTYAALPPQIKVRAKVVYRLWQQNPRHPSLQFQKTGNVWSVRIGSGYRAMSLLQVETTVVSYFTGRATRDLVIAAHQEETRALWPRLSSEFDLTWNFAHINNRQT